MLDALVIGAGPAGLSLAALLATEGLKVQGLAPADPAAPWPNTYGIWVDELESLGLTALLAHRWKNCVVHVNDRTLPLKREYGLLDKVKLQDYWLGQNHQHQVTWHQGLAADLSHFATYSQVTTQAGQTIQARLVIDTTGHQAQFIQRRPAKAVAFQAAYGIVGKFSAPPVDPQQMVLMDYRDDHLTPAQRQASPTFLYAMDLGDGVYFAEETSLAQVPAVSFELLEQRLYQRLAHRGITVERIDHVEHCLFPMNLPVPDLAQPVVGFGGAASMVHPASGYMVGALLRRGPVLATAIAAALSNPHTSPREAAQIAWQALWPRGELCKHHLYLFGLENLMDFDPPQLQHFFTTFFSLPTADWAGFLADSLTVPELVQAMLGLFGRAPNDVRWGLMTSVGRHGDLLLRAVSA